MLQMILVLPWNSKSSLFFKKFEMGFNFCPPKKKKILWICPQRVSKEARFCAASKKGSNNGQQFFLYKNRFLGTVLCGKYRPSVGNWPKIRPQNSKGTKLNMKSYWRGVFFPPQQKFVPDRLAIFVSIWQTRSLGQKKIWFGCTAS